MKIVPENAAAIEAELAKANGRASSHTVTSFAEVADLRAQLARYGVGK